MCKTNRKIGMDCFMVIMLLCKQKQLKYLDYEYYQNVIDICHRLADDNNIVQRRTEK